MKWLLFLGLGLLTLGVVFNRVFNDAIWPLVLIFAGVGLKATYIFLKISKSNYRPGTEMWYLASGLIIFFTGLYLSPHADAGIISFPNFLKITGITLKVVFVVLFIRKTRRT